MQWRARRPAALAVITIATLAALAALAGCSSGSSSSVAMSSPASVGHAAAAAPAASAAASAPANGAFAASGSASSGGVAGGQGGAGQDTSARYLPDDQQLVYTAELTVRAKNVGAALSAATAIVTSAGGYVSAENSTGQGAGQPASEWQPSYAETI